MTRYLRTKRKKLFWLLVSSAGPFTFGLIWDRTSWQWQCVMEKADHVIAARKLGEIKKGTRYPWRAYLCDLHPPSSPHLLQFPPPLCCLLNYKPNCRLIHQWEQSPHNPVFPNSPTIWFLLHGGQALHAWVFDGYFTWSLNWNFPIFVYVLGTYHFVAKKKYIIYIKSLIFLVGLGFELGASGL
jgi:hypothetical protein